MLHVESRQFSATAPAFNLPNLRLVLPLGMTPYELCWDFWHQKTRVWPCFYDPMFNHNAWTDRQM